MRAWGWRIQVASRSDDVVSAACQAGGEFQAADRVDRDLIVFLDGEPAAVATIAGVGEDEGPAGAAPGVVEAEGEDVDAVVADGDLGRRCSGS